MIKGVIFDMDGLCLLYTSHIVGVELAGVGEAVCRNFHRCTSFPIKCLATV